MFGSLAAKTSNGPITLSGGDRRNCEGSLQQCAYHSRARRFAEKLWMQTSNGPVRAEDVEAPDLTFKTTANAAITGTVVGDMRDYAISSRTSNAQNNLPMDCAYEDQSQSVCGPPPATAASTCASCSTAVPRTGLIQQNSA